MKVEEIEQNFPFLYHMAEAGTWQSVNQRGLLSTSALLDLWKVAGPERRAIEECHRPGSVTISHPKLGKVTIRDQQPMDDKGLARALAGTNLTPRDWYKKLNGRVFFWVTRERLLRLLKAKLYRSRLHTILTVESAPLIKKYAQEIELAGMNTGCTKPMPHARGPLTFQPILSHPFDERRRRRQEGIVELTIKYAVPDIANYVVRVEHMRGEVVTEVIFSK